MGENTFWKVCEALDCPQRVELLRYLLSVEKTEFPCVTELAEIFSLSVAAVSVHLKKLAEVGLLVSKRADRRVYYRAFPSTPEGERIVGAFREFFAKKPDGTRLRDLGIYIHALSHYRRNAIIRCLHNRPGLDVKTLSMTLDMPYPTAVRLLAELDKAHVVDTTLTVIKSMSHPERTLLNLTLR